MKRYIIHKGEIKFGWIIEDESPYTDEPVFANICFDERTEVDIKADDIESIKKVVYGLGMEMRKDCIKEN